MIGRLVPEAAKRRVRRWVIDEFHTLWWNSPDTWRKNTWMGRTVFQQPMDMMLYQQLVLKERPAFVLQTGVFHGGSLLYFAHLLDLMGAPPSAVVVGVDLTLTDEAKTLRHPRVHMIEGDSVAPETVKRVEGLLPGPHGLVSLDSDHSAGHVLKELRVYTKYVKVGTHMVVEDTNVNHPIYPTHGPGPYEGLEEFFRENSDFVRDDAMWRRNLFSFHQGGWLLRVK